MVRDWAASNRWDLQLHSSTKFLVISGDGGRVDKKLRVHVNMPGCVACEDFRAEFAQPGRFAVGSDVGAGDVMALLDEQPR